MATDYIMETEVPIAMKRHEKMESLTIPIIIRPCMWEYLPFAKLQAFPEKGKPVTDYEDRDTAWIEIVKAIYTFVK